MNDVLFHTISVVVVVFWGPYVGGSILRDLCPVFYLAKIARNETKRNNKRNGIDRLSAHTLNILCIEIYAYFFLWMVLILPLAIFFSIRFLSHMKHKSDTDKQILIK